MTCQPQGEQPRLLLSESCQANRSHCAVKRMGPRLRKGPYFGKFGTLATGKEPLPWNTDCGSRSRGSKRRRRGGEDDDDDDGVGTWELVH